MRPSAVIARGKAHPVPTVRIPSSSHKALLAICDVPNTAGGVVDMVFRTYTVILGLDIVSVSWII